MAKKSRKSSRRKLWQTLFWLVFVAGALWIAFVPPTKHRPRQPVSVKVEQPVMPEEKPSYAEHSQEETLPPDIKPLPPSEPVIPPVTPEAVRPSKASAPKIAIVIDDVGLDLRGSQRAIELPAFVTLSFMPYATRLREQTRAARENGHELLLHMPMEPIGNADPGPGALRVDLPPDEIRLRFQTALASFVGFDGVNNHMGSKFTSDSAGMTIVVDELKQRRLFFLDSRTSAKSVGFAVAREYGLPALSRDVFLDDDMSAKAVREQLEQTEIVARRKGYAIAIGHPHAVTLQALEEWIAEAEQRGYVFVPLNSFIRIDTTSPP